MKLDCDDFELLNLPRRHALPAAVLDERRKALQSQVHPDRYAGEGAAAQRLAMQWAVRVNEAWQRLKDPVRRAAYLCELAGVPIDAERNTAMPAAFLMQQMSWREALDEAREQPGPQAMRALEALQTEVQAQSTQWLAQIEQALDHDHDPVAGAALVRAMMFIQRLQQQITDRLHALEDEATP